MGFLYRTALVLVIVGAVNWGLIGFFQFDLVAALFGGADSILSRIVYALVGISGLVCIPLLAKPLDESEAPTTSRASTSQATYKNPSYQTEFAEEDGFDDADSVHSKRNYNNSKGNSSYKKDK